MELLQHDTMLKDLIPNYEARFKELFMHNGRHYVGVIDADSSELKTYLTELVSNDKSGQKEQPKMRSFYGAGRDLSSRGYSN